MIADLYAVYLGDGIYAFKTKIKDKVYKSICEASCVSEAQKKAHTNITQALWKDGFLFGRGGLEWNMIFKDPFGKTALITPPEKKDKDRVWYVDKDENGVIRPHKLETEPMTLEEAKAYTLELIFGGKTNG